VKRGAAISLLLPASLEIEEQSRGGVALAAHHNQPSGQILVDGEGFTFAPAGVRREENDRLSGIYA